jgi:hypothetical protein
MQKVLRIARPLPTRVRGCSRQIAGLGIDQVADAKNSEAGMRANGYPAAHGGIVDRGRTRGLQAEEQLPLHPHRVSGHAAV